MRVLALAAALVAAAAPAAHAERVAVVGASPCTPELRSIVAAVQTAVRRRLDVELLDDEALSGAFESLLALDIAASQQILSDADRSFRDGDFERAGHLLDSVIDSALGSAPGDARWATLREALSRKAWIDDKRSSEASTLDATRILRLEPTYVPDPRVFPPRVQRLFEDALLALRRQPTAEMAVTSDQPGMRVDIDGREMGLTPLRLPLTVGSYRVELVTDDGRVATRAVTLDAAQEVRFEKPAPVCLAEETAAEQGALAVRVGAAELVGVSSPESGGPIRVRVTDVGGETTALAYVDATEGRLSPAAMEALTDLIGSGEVSAPLRRQPADVTGAPTLRATDAEVRGSSPVVPTLVVGGGASAIAAALAIALGVDGHSAKQGLTAYLTPDGTAYVAGSQPAVSGLMSRAGTDGTAEVISAIATGVLVAATVAVVWLEARHAASESSSAAVVKSTK